MKTYALGKGHIDLANQLGITRSDSLAIGGSANTRIIRTTLKHSYHTDVPTLYILGMTFLSRLEIPILDNQNEFEGRWTNPQNQAFVNDWQLHWTQKDTNQFVELKLKSEAYSILDRIEDLMYRLVTMITDLQQRGHRVLVFQHADDLYQGFLNDERLKLFQRSEFVGGYAWRATPWQHEQGVNATVYDPPMPVVSPETTHRAVGEHQQLNEYLCNYIHTHNILGEKNDLEPL
jgi:hypothetical protein